HQIGTPLNLISGYVQMIQTDLPSESASAVRLRTVQEQIRTVTTIVQGLLNLITNSIDAMPGGGELLVTAGASGGQVEVTVADSGSGIDPGDVARVFDPLFTTKEPGKGTGLGLTIARDVVTAHGGTIAVTSRRHEGTEVKVRLPIARSAAEPRH